MGFLNKDAIATLDGFDLSSSYQMVPVNGRRELLIQTGKNQATLNIQDRSKAILSNFRFADTGAFMPLGEAQFVRLPANTKIRFTVKGLVPGFTGLELTDDDAQFQITTSITVSVKETKQVNYSFVFLSDSIHKNVRGQIEPRFLMDKVKPIFLEQANLELNEFGFMRDVNVLGNLGNPILSSKDEVLDKIEAATGDEAFTALGPDGFIIYLCWDIERVRGKSDTRGLTLHRGGSGKVYAFIEPGRSFSDTVHTLAHEIGHALGLSHIKELGLMFPRIPPASNFLLGGDIEVLNPAP